MINAGKALLQRLNDRDLTVGVVGLGHVGLPLAVEAARSGFSVLGFDVDPQVVDSLNSNVCLLVSEPQAPKRTGSSGELQATTDLTRLSECDAVVLCVPTPLNKVRDPDLSHVIAVTQAICSTLRPGQLIVLESTTYPGTTRDVLMPMLASSGLRVGTDIFLCFSPERVDPGNATWNVRNTPRLLGGITPACAEVGAALYRSMIDYVHVVQSVEVAELAKVYENTYRMVNIALANELAQACARLELDVWEVLAAAATKPFGFVAFSPGPGLGGHCIPLDPHYLAWKMETLDFKTRLIELASEINAAMPDFVVDLVTDALNDEARAVRGSCILILGVAYKPNVNDYRESPALEIIRTLQMKGAEVHYHDPHCPFLADAEAIGSDSQGLRSVELTDELLSGTDAVVLVTDHDAMDYDRLVANVTLIVDCRGRLRGAQGRARIIGLSGRTQPSQEPRTARDRA